MKQTIRLSERELRSMVTEAVVKMLKEEEEPRSAADRLSDFHDYKKYFGHDSNPNKLEKSFNKGMGRMEFIQVIPEENVLLVNKSLVGKGELDRIKQAFPEYKIEMVELGYPDYYRKGLSQMRKK